MSTFIILLLCFCLGWITKLTIEAYQEGPLYERIIGTIICCFLGLFIAITHYASQENLKHEVMQNYFNGKIEVVERIDTIRTFKFN